MLFEVAGREKFRWVREATVCSRSKIILELQVELIEGLDFVLRKGIGIGFPRCKAKAIDDGTVLLDEACGVDGEDLFVVDGDRALFGVEGGKQGATYLADGAYGLLPLLFETFCVGFLAAHPIGYAGGDLRHGSPEVGRRVADQAHAEGLDLRVEFVFEH